MNRIKRIWEAQEKAYREMMEDEQYCHPESFRWGFEQGVDWAEEDLALTWEDIKAIVTIADSMLTHTAWDAIDWPDEQKYYEEVLRRFNSQREKK